MKLTSIYPVKAIKLYHITPGTVIQLTPNDGTVDNAFYVVTDLDSTSAKYRSIMNVVTGDITAKSVSTRCICFPDATLHTGERE